MRRCRRSGLGVCGRNEQPRDGTARTASLRHIDHRSNQKTHHVMEKSVCRNFKRPAAVARYPRRMMNKAAVMIVDRRCVSDGKSTKRVFSQQTGGFRM